MSDADVSRTSDGEGLAASPRQLWRLHGPSQVVIAAIHPHARGAELRLFYEPESRADVLAREHGDAERLVRRAAIVRERLVNRGWVELGSSAPKPLLMRRPRRRTVAGLSLLAASAAALSWWRRTTQARVHAAPGFAATPGPNVE